MDKNTTVEEEVGFLLLADAIYCLQRLVDFKIHGRG
jgi:hypothetical protein